jgi:hypothetical protein
MPSVADFDSLMKLAAARGIDLLDAYEAAGLSDSTYYRHVHRRNGMTVDTYNLVHSFVSAMKPTHRRRRSQARHRPDRKPAPQAGGTAA